MLKKGRQCQQLTSIKLKQVTNFFEKKLSVGGFSEVFYMASCQMGKKLELKLYQQVLTKAN